MNLQQPSHRERGSCDLILGAQDLIDPLTSILGYTQLLLKSGHLGEEEKHQLQAIEQGAGSLAAKIDALMALLSEDIGAESTGDGVRPGTDGARPGVGTSADHGEPPVNIRARALDG